MNKWKINLVYNFLPSKIIVDKKIEKNKNYFTSKNVVSTYHGWQKLFLTVTQIDQTWTNESINPV